MTQHAADRNLLFGVIALEMDFIDREQLVEAMRDWVVDKTKPLAQLLVDRGAMQAGHRALLDPLVEAHVQRHNNDPQQSLASVAGASSIRDVLTDINDSDVQQSIAGWVNMSKARDSFATQACPPLPPSVSGGRFRILRPHARGGLGEVFVAEDGEVRREVALKKIDRRHADDPDSRSRFLLEGEITGGLEHPNIVPVYGLGTYADGRPYYAMRFIRGDSFNDAIERFHRADARAGTSRTRRLELRKLLQRFIDVCNAVEYAHSRGVLHRDLKPGNVMLGKYGETLVVDWGLAKVMGRSDPQATFNERPLAASSGSADTQMGSALGTPAFMSPEQACGRLDLLGPRSDVYGLGATLYCLLTGKAPYAGDDVGEILRRVQAGDCLTPRQVDRTIDKTLDAVCRRAMALRPEDRYDSARAVADDVEHWLADEPTQAYSESIVDRMSRWARRNRTWTRAGAAALLLISLVSITAAALIQRSNSNEIRALRTTAATDNFNRGLDVDDWTTAHLDYMEGLLSQLDELRYSHVGEFRERLAAAYADTLRERLQAAVVTPEDAAEIESRLAWLDARNSELAESVRAEINNRVRIWQPVFELKPPFAELAELFDAVQAEVRGQAVVFKPNAPAAAPTDFIASRLGSAGNVRLQAIFEPSWEDHAQIGLALQAADDRGYEFVLRTILPRGVTATADTPAPSFRNQRAVDAPLRLEIRRRGVVLHRNDPAFDTIPSGPLRMAVERRRDFLSVQINSLPPLEIYDPFPLDGSASKFAVCCPQPAGLAELSGLRQTEPLLAGPLDAADRLYDRREFATALSAYVFAAAQTELSEVRHEARTKQGLCLTALGKIDEAIAMYATVVSEPGERWPPLAGLHQWLLLEKRQRYREADDAFELLSVKFRFDQLAAIVPQDLRNQMFAAQRAQFADASALSRWTAARVGQMERAAAIDRMLSPDGLGQYDIQRNLMRAYVYAGDLQRAVPLAESQHAGRNSPETLRQLVRLYCWTGSPQRAITVASRFLESELEMPTSFPWRNAIAEAYLCRARARIANNDYQSAAKDVEEADRAVVITSFNTSSNTHIVGGVYLLRGVLQERRGEHDAAAATYHAGFAKIRNRLQRANADETGALYVLILGSWCGELTDDEATDRLELLLGRPGDDPVYDAIKSMVRTDSAGSALRAMWLSPRGKQIALDAVVYEAVPTDEKFRLVLMLLGSEFARQTAFGGNPSDEQAELVWSVAGRFLDLFNSSILTPPQMMQLLLSWKGTTNILGWGGVAPALDKSLRADLAYILGARMRQRKDKRAAKAFFDDCLAHAPEGSLARRLATADLKKLSE